LQFNGALADQAGVILGTSGGGLTTQDENYRVVYEEGKNRVHPFIVPKLMNNAAVSQVSMEFKTAWCKARARVFSFSKITIMRARAARISYAKSPVSPCRRMHPIFGGTGAVELLACVMALRDGVIAPTIGYAEPDPECAMDVVPNTARDADVDVVLSNAFAFGGLNAVIALRKI